MNILTKICVVVLVVVNLFASAVFIAYANGSENLKQKCENLESARQAAEVTAGNQMVHASLLQTEKATLQSQLVAVESGAREKIDALNVQVGKLETANSAQQINQQGILTQIAGLRTDIQAMEVSRSETIKALAEANRAKEEVQKENTELQGKLAQIEADLRRQAGTIDVLRRDNANLREQTERLSELVAKGGGSSDVGGGGGGNAAPVANVRGQVTAVQGDAVSINVGSAKGVREGMIMVIHRKDLLVGYLRIDEVDVDQAAGVIEEKQADPQQGDAIFQKDV